MPSRRITSAKKFAESVAVVAATIEKPISHQGMECPELKKSPAVPRLLSEARAGRKTQWEVGNGKNAGGGEKNEKTPGN